MALNILERKVLGVLTVQLKDHEGLPLTDNGEPCEVVFYSRGSETFERAFNAYRQKMRGDAVSPDEQKKALFEMMNACIIRYNNITVGEADAGDTKQITRTIFDDVGLGFILTQIEPLMVSWEKQKVMTATN
jgi:hypothetical protein